MNQFINQLENEHKQLVAILEKVKQVGITSDEGKELLKQAKNGLLNHLKLEDSKLYPVLNKAAANDESLKRNLDRFAKEMQQISTFAIEFFTKYETISNEMEFARDFGKLYSTLGMRISREESILYKKYAELEQ